MPMLEEKIEFGTARQMIAGTDEDFSNPSELVRINLACGEHKKEGFVGVDVEKTSASEMTFDLLKFPWPIESNSVYEFFCSHFVEHIPHDLHNGKRTDGLVQFMDEVYRCLMPQGTITIICPYYTSIRAWQDPTHCRVINEVTWRYFSKEGRKGAGVDHYVGNAVFEILTQQFILDDAWIHRAEEARVWAMRHYWNVVQDLQVMLRAIK